MLENYKGSFLNFFEKYQNFIILGHKEPDADCICSQVVLSEFFKKKGKKTCLLNEGPFKRQEIVSLENYFSKEVPSSWVESDIDKTAVCVVDCSTLDRVGEIGKSFKNLPICMLDHHSAGEKFGVVEVVDESIPSTTLIIQIVGEWLDIELEKEEAELLFMGFATDTGFFRFLGVQSAPWVAQVSKMIEKGASPRDLSLKLGSNKSFNFISYLETLLSRVRSYSNNRILTTYEIKEERPEGENSSDSDYIYQTLMMVESVEVVVFLKESKKDKKITVSLRSKHFVDVGHFSFIHFGGGGHKHAAGMGVEGTTIEALEKEIVDKLKREFP